MILHAGTHKTGTTSIQMILAQNRNWLHERGYAYPKLRGRAHDHNALARRLMLAENDDSCVWQTLTQTSEHTLILSAEELWGITRRHEDWNEFCHPHYWQRRIERLQRVRAALSDFEQIIVLICFRRQDEYAASLYATKLLNGRFRGSFEDFRSRSKPLFDYRRQLEAFRSMFDNVQFTSFDALKNNLVPAFCDWAGIPVPPRGLVRREKITPAARLVRWVDKHRTEGDPEHMIRQRIAFVTSEHATSTLVKIGKGTFWSSELDRRSFLAGCSDPEPGFFSPATERLGSDSKLQPPADADFRRIDHAFNTWRLAQQRPRPAPQGAS